MKKRKKLKKNNSLINIKPIHILSLLFLTAIFFRHYLSLSNSTLLNESTLHQAIFPTSSIIPSPTDIQKGFDDLFDDKYIKRQYLDTDKFVGTEKYPSLLVSEPNDGLIDMECTKKILSKQSTNSFISYLDRQINPKNFSITWVQLCKTEDNRIILHYGLQDSKGQNKIQNIALVSNDLSNIQIKASISDLDPLYFPCDHPLQLLKNNDYYFACIGGDTRSWGTIYKISLDPNESNTNPIKIYSCADDSDTDSPIHEGTICD